MSLGHRLSDTSVLCVLHTVSSILSRVVQLAPRPLERVEVTNLKYSMPEGILDNDEPLFDETLGLIFKLSFLGVLTGD